MNSITRSAQGRFSTHDVKNQADLPIGFNAFENDIVLKNAIEREAPWAFSRCSKLGALVGSEDIQELARLANRHNPELQTHDRFGNRVDWVNFHPAWHDLMTLAWQHEVPNLSWRTQESHPHYARAVLSYLWNQIEQGTGCPTGMAYASHAGFASEPALKIWQEKSLGTLYENSRNEVSKKSSVVIGYAMTEKQGGSDLRETTTTAEFSHSDNYHGATAHWYELTGHKWFCSVPQSDGFFTLAKVNGALSCFFLPRTLPDGTHNRFLIQRLKEKAGNRSNASSEIEMNGTLAILVGSEGRGIKEIISHSHLTRLDFAVGSAGLMRQCLSLAVNHTSTRNGFGSSLAKRPMMSNVLADMAVEVEACTLLALRVAKATDYIEADPLQKAFARITTPVAKFFNCSRVVCVANEALQCHGGNGFVEDGPMARLFRESPLNSVWEGTSNMMCMDVRRSMIKDRMCKEALFEEVKEIRKDDTRFDNYVTSITPLLDEAIDNEFLARPATEAIARVIQGSELLRNSTPEVINAFMDSRLTSTSTNWGTMFGSLGGSVSKQQADKIVARAEVFK
jgi:putative acyl-CoA dehydrogenase